jgi:hypothetical protein
MKKYPSEHAPERLAEEDVILGDDLSSDSVSELALPKTSWGCEASSQLTVCRPCNRKVHAATSAHSLQPVLISVSAYRLFHVGGFLQIAVAEAPLPS